MRARPCKCSLQDLNDLRSIFFVDYGDIFLPHCLHHLGMISDFESQTCSNLLRLFSLTLFFSFYRSRLFPPTRFLCSRSGVSGLCSLLAHSCVYRGSMGDCLFICCCCGCKPFVGLTKGLFCHLDLAFVSHSNSLSKVLSSLPSPLYSSR